MMTAASWFGTRSTRPSGTAPAAPNAATTGGTTQQERVVSDLAWATVESRPVHSDEVMLGSPSVD